MGNESFYTSLGRAAEILSRQAAEGVRAACLILMQAAREEAPRDGGGLRASIGARVTRTGDTIHGEVFARAPYAPYVHNGTGVYAPDGRKTSWRYRAGGVNPGWRTTAGQRPDPFLRRAVAARRGEIAGILASAFTGGDAR